MKSMRSLILLGLKDILKPKIVVVLLLPFISSMVIWSLITYFSWNWITGLGLEIYNFSLIQQFVKLIAPYFIFTANPLVFVTTAVFIILVILPAAMITALLITSIVLVPLLVSELRKSDFPSIVKKSTNMFTGTTISIGYSIKYMASWVGSLPFWILIPGGALIIPYLLIAWFNSRLLTWEILAEISTPEDIKPFAEAHSKPLFLLGLITSILYYIPLLNFIAPVLVSSIFTRYCLSHFSNFTKPEVS